MSYINESCGCDGGNEYSSVISNSPILSGSQEIAFSPNTDNFSFLDGLNETSNSGNSILSSHDNNNFSNNDEAKQTYSLDDLISMSKENKTQNNENKFSNNNIQEMNNNQFNYNFTERVKEEVVINIDKVSYSSNFYNTKNFVKSKKYKFY